MTRTAGSQDRTGGRPGSPASHRRAREPSRPPRRNSSLGLIDQPKADEIGDGLFGAAGAERGEQSADLGGGLRIQVPDLTGDLGRITLRQQAGDLVLAGVGDRKSTR